MPYLEMHRKNTLSFLFAIAGIILMELYTNYKLMHAIHENFQEITLTVQQQRELIASEQLQTTLLQDYLRRFLLRNDFPMPSTSQPTSQPAGNPTTRPE